MIRVRIFKLGIHKERVYMDPADAFKIIKKKIETHSLPFKESANFIKEGWKFEVLTD